MAWKAVTPDGAYCSTCGAPVEEGASSCKICKEPFSKTVEAVVCKICGCFTPASHSRCSSCGIQIGEIEIEDVEVSEEELSTVITRIVGREIKEKSDGAEEENEEGIDIEVASIIYQELITNLEKLEKLGEDLFSLDRLPDWRKIQKINRFWPKFKEILDRLSEIRRILSSSQGKVFFEGGKGSVLERARMREERLQAEVARLRRELIAREIALLMADDEFLMDLSRDIATMEHDSEPVDMEELRRILATIDRLLALLPKGILAQFAHSKEYIAFEKMLAKYGL